MNIDPQCYVCLYLLKGLPKDHNCPECGWKIDWELARLPPRPRFVLSRKVLTVMLLVTIGIPIIQQFALGRGILAIKGADSGLTLDHVFRRIWNSISVIQFLGILAVVLMIRGLWSRSQFLVSSYNVIAVMAISVTCGGTFARDWLLWRGAHPLDFFLTVACVVVFILVRQRFMAARRLGIHPSLWR